MRLTAKIALSCVALVSAAVCGSAMADTLLYSDNFTYANGNLVGQGGWVAHSGAGSTPVQVASNAIVLAQGAGSREDVSHDIGLTMAAGDVWRYEFDLTVGGTAAATNVYFAHFKDAAAGTLFNSRLYLAAPTNGGDFTFGIEEVSGTAPGATFSLPFSFNTTYRVFAEYDFDLGTTDLWIDTQANGVITSTTADIAQPMSMMAFRQSAGNTTMTIDNLEVYSVSAIPEPATGFALLGLAGLLPFVRRRIS